MFGRMMLTPILQVGADSDLQTAIHFSWTPTRDGLIITFGQYAIAPYAAGMPEAQIPWSDLKPYLAPDLQPTTLSAAAPKPTP